MTLEVFNLVGGISFLVGLDPSAEPEAAVPEFGNGIDFGLLSRPADTHFFADTRVVAFCGLDFQDSSRNRAGFSTAALIGWANNGFRTGVDRQLLFDFLSDKNALLIGGTIGGEF